MKLCFFCKIGVLFIICAYLWWLFVSNIRGILCTDQAAPECRQSWAWVKFGVNVIFRPYGRTIMPSFHHSVAVHRCRSAVPNYVVPEIIT